MTYTYPRSQSLFEDTVFLIAETVKSNSFDEYHIPYKKGNSVCIFKIRHAYIKRAIELGVVKLLERPGSFNDKPFYRIPIISRLTLF